MKVSMNEEELTKLAIRWTCPLGSDPITVYEKNTVERLIAFGRAVIKSQQEPELGKCETCRRWINNLRDKRYGECSNPKTFGYVRGDAFEPPGWFGCINHEPKIRDAV
jgi:hypothetical protein